MYIGGQIKQIRKKKGLSQKQLAEQLGISTNAMCSIEKGYAWPSGITMEKMCRLLNVELKLIEK
jgi:transcriptional regulator with XRE-family HTH domain